MPPKAICRVSICITLLMMCRPCDAQRMFVNTPTDVYELLGTPGNYTLKNWGDFCVEGHNNIASAAMHGDTLYLLTVTNDLYEILLSAPGSCRLLANLTDPASDTYFLGLACYKNGILYGTSGADLYSYDPHSNTKTFLGTLPAVPDGDLVFYKDTLLCAAGGSAIYAVNLANPSASTKFMTTSNYQFWGLANMPGDCKTDKLYGFDGSTNKMVQIDPATRTITGVVDSIPLGVFDACSTLEDGSVAGVLFDSLAVLPACGNTTGGSVEVFASSAADGTTIYTLDGASTNTTGLFSGVAIGSHSILIQASGGCTTDSIFMLKQGLSAVNLQVALPDDCAHPDGSIQASASSQYLPILYSINGNPPQANPVFSQLTNGQYTLSISDAGHCQLDTSIALGFQHLLPFPGSIAITPSFCEQKNGSITVTLNSSTDPSAITAALNTGGFQSSLTFPGLGAGSDSLHVYSTDGCRFDSLLSVGKLEDPEPAIQAGIRNQLCFVDNGAISVSLTGAYGPYLGSLDGGAYGSSLNFDGLTPTTHTVSIQDKNTCSWDSTFTIQPYPKDPVTLAIDTVNPVCTTLNSGSLTIAVQGDQAPYWLALGNATYASGSTISQLTYGDYSLPVIDGDGCVVDSAHAHLRLDLKPECNSIYLPNAFTPNGNGVNDLFRVMHSPYLTTLQLRVYNRYGGLLFASSGERPGWDGAFHGDPQPAGTYVWEVDYTDLEKTPKTTHGILLLIR